MACIHRLEDGVVEGLKTVHSVQELMRAGFNVSTSLIKLNQPSQRGQRPFAGGRHSYVELHAASPRFKTQGRLSQILQVELYT